MLSNMIALPLAAMAALTGTATASPITAGGTNVTPARAALTSGRFTYYDVGRAPAATPTPTPSWSWR